MDVVRRLLFFTRLLSVACCSLAKCVVGALAILLALIGVFAVWDAPQVPRLPAVRPLIIPIESEPLALNAEKFASMSNAERWEHMATSLHYLDLVCPEVSEWVRGRWDTGRLVFDTNSPLSERCYAWYQHVRGVLGITMHGLARDEVELACTLAHEFRHSRQSLFQVVQVAIADLVGVRYRRDVMESEAYDFEDQVRKGIRDR